MDAVNSVRWLAIDWTGFNPLTGQHLPEYLGLQVGQKLGQQMGQQALDRLITPVQDWLATHPLVHWLLVHPLGLLGATLTTIVLVAGLIGALTRLSESLWMAVLQAPLQLLQGLGQGLLWLARSPFRQSPPPAPDNQQQRLAQLLDRLEGLKQEQEQVLREVKAIVATQSTDRRLRSDAPLIRLNPIEQNPIERNPIPSPGAMNAQELLLEGSAPNPALPLIRAAQDDQPNHGHTVPETVQHHRSQ